MNSACAIMPMSVSHWTAFKGISLHDWQTKYVPSPHTLIRLNIFERRPDQQFFLYAICYQQQLVGGFTLSVTDDNQLWLGAIQIDKNYQSKGLASYVFKQVIQYLRNDPALVGLSLDVHSSNLTALEFYQRQGLKICGMLVRDGEDVWLMHGKREQWL